MRRLLETTGTVLVSCPAVKPDEPSLRCALLYDHEPEHDFRPASDALAFAQQQPALQRLAAERGTGRHKPCNACGAYRSLGESHTPTCAKWNARINDPKRVGLWETRTAQMSDEWSTPRPLYNRLNRAWGPFTLDVASSAKNHLCPEYLTKAMDAPRLHVGTHRCWDNPPYSRGNLARFMRWALTETVRSAPVFCNLVPHYTSEGWWQDNVAAPKLDLGVRLGIEEEEREGMTFVGRHWERLSIWTHALAGRVAFVEASGATGPARFASAIVVYERPNR